MRVAKPLFDPVAYRGATNRRRFYEEVTLPRNLVVLGDAVCTFNPAYGQGISTAALQAATLQTQLQVPLAAQQHQISQCVGVHPAGMVQQRFKLHRSPFLLPIANAVAVKCDGATLSVRLRGGAFNRGKRI